MIRFADGLPVIAVTGEKSGDALTQTNKEYNMKINDSKINTSVCGKRPLNTNMIIENRKLETAERFISVK